MTDFAAAAGAIVATGRWLDQRSLAPATAGNYSVLLADRTIAVTASGVHKGRLTDRDVMRVSSDGVPIGGGTPSAETPLHCMIYDVDPNAGAVLHTHSVAGVVLSRALAGRDAFRLEGYELLKVFPGIDTHDVRVDMPVVDNSQDIPALAVQVRALLAARRPILPAFYIRGHGLYGWGSTIAAAQDIIEASEYLLACELETLKLQGSPR